MSVQTAKKVYQLNEWANQIQGRLQSGHTVREWCEMQSISTKTYYYRLRCVREKLLETTGADNMLALAGKTEFARISLPRSNNSAVTVRIGGFSAEINNDASYSTVEQVLRVLSQL